jgi:hypothetical protein
MPLCFKSGLGSGQLLLLFYLLYVILCFVPPLLCGDSLNEPIIAGVLGTLRSFKFIVKVGCDFKIRLINCAWLVLTRLLTEDHLQVSQILQDIYYGF